MTRWCKAASILLAAGATAGSALVFAQEKSVVVAPQPESNARAARDKDTPIFEVKPGMLRVVVIEPGSLEASRAQDVYCLVEAPTPEAANQVHAEAHGLVADELVAVQEGS